jgi:DUF4097 and DUF4098 domain-containing protein YvlB
MVLVLALAAASCGDSGATEEFTFDDEPAAVVVDAGSGSVTIGANPRGGAEVTATVSYGATRPTVTAELVDGVLSVDDDCRNDCSVDYRILVGETADVTVGVGSGTITISEVEGTIVAETGSGDVSLSSVVGMLDVTTGSGDVLGTRLVSAGATISTGSGSVDVTFDDPITELTIDSGSGNVTAQLAGGPYAVVATTGSGDVDVQVDEDGASALAVTISTGSGDVTVYRK